MENQESIQTQISHLNRVIRTALKRAQRKLEKQNLEFSQAEKWNKHKEIGDTILANIFQLKKGVSKVNLVNVHTNCEEDIELDPALLPNENADKYYKMAQKGKRAVDVISGFINKSQEEIEFLEKLQKDTEAILNIPDKINEPEIIDALLKTEEQLIEKRYLPKKTEKNEKKEPDKKFRKIVFEDKWSVYIGKNASDNDELTLHFAKPDDLWFHAYGSPGSHVVLRRNRDEVIPKHIIEKTASLAAWFSQQKHSTKVPVNYTEKRYVRKPRKSPAGLVVIEREKTIYVKPYNPHDDN